MRRFGHRLPKAYRLNPWVISALVPALPPRWLLQPRIARFVPLCLEGSARPGNFSFDRSESAYPAHCRRQRLRGNRT
jgi:hypothetical protein